MNNSNGKPSMLVVDDEPVVRDSLSKWFLQDGYRVEAACDGASALKLMSKGPWDIILLDIKMPGMSGLELQKQIKTIDRSATIIMITAFASVESAVQALKEGAFDYVTKPVDPDHSVATAHEKGWATLTNGDLLAAAEGSFDVVLAARQE